MLKTIRKLFSPPIFENENKTRAARYLNAILIASFLLLLSLVLSGQYVMSVTVALVVINVCIVGMYILLRREQVTSTAILYVSIIWLAMTYLAWTGEGVLDISLMVYVVLILLASLLGNSRISIFLTALSVAAAWILFYAEENGLLIPVHETLLANTLSTSGIFIIAGVIIYYTVTDLENNLISLKENEKNLIARNKELSQLQENLQEHANELEKVNQKAKEQAARLKLITEVSQEITLTQDLTELLPKITEKISEGFGFHHVGIFFLEEDEKIARLQATNSTEGKKMLRLGYQIDTNGNNIIARVVRKRKPQVAFEINENHNDFEAGVPETRSKIGLPLKIGERIIGALDIQSTDGHIFSEEEIESFESLANQVAIAVENARQATITRFALKEAQETSRKYVQQVWTQLAIEKRQQDYRYTNKSAMSLPEKGDETLVKSENTISIPVQLHEEIIGFVEISRDPSAKNMSKEEEELVQAIVNRAALALENARLLEETSRRAGREQLVSEITTKIRSTNDPQEMIQTALNELKNALGATKVELARKSSK